MSEVGKIDCILKYDVAPGDGDEICKGLPKPRHITFIREVPTDAFQELDPMDASFRQPSVFRLDPNVLKTKFGFDKTQREMLDVGLGDD